MTDSVVLQLRALLGPAFCSSLLPGAGSSSFSRGRAPLARMADRSGPNGGPPMLIERPHDLLVTLLIGISLVNIAGAGLAAHLAHRLVGPTLGPVVEMLGMILLVTTFGEVLPMTLAVKYPERFLAVVRRPVAWLGAVLAPVRAVLGGLTRLTVQLIGRDRQGQPELSEDELRTLVDVGASEGVVERDGFQALETEQGGIKVYETALRCVQNDDLRQEFEEYLEQTQKHEQILHEVFEKDLGPDTATAVTQITRFDPDKTWQRSTTTEEGSR